MLLITKNFVAEDAETLNEPVESVSVPPLDPLSLTAAPTTGKPVTEFTIKPDTFLSFLIS